ncbi:MAG: HAMP domain-containing histidine kinase [Desulfovibrionaceae bacterium]|nr:HAMP domain-containing histidine kinase [Desulfovibrionaceae bacterium]
MGEPTRKVLEAIALKIPVVHAVLDQPRDAHRRSRPLLGILIFSLLIAVSLPLIYITVIFPAYTDLLVATIETGAERLAAHAVPASVKYERLSHRSIDSVRLLADIYRLEKDFGLLEIGLYSPEGATVYSSDASKVGSINKDPAFLREVAKGKVHSRLFSTTRPGPGNTPVPVEAVETYIPLMKRGAFLGAFRFQFDISNVKSSMDRFNTYATYGSIAASLCVLLVVVILLNKESSRLAALRRADELMEDVNLITRHDLKSPLASTLTGISFLKQYTETSAEQREVLDEMHAAAITGLDLINRSLDIYKMETGRYDYRPVPVDLTPLCRRVAADLSGPAAERDVTIKVGRVDVSPGESDSLTAAAEETLCYSLLANLVKNAVEASAPGHKVTVTLSSADNAIITVHNTGCVPESIRESFFEKFATAGKSGGTGLGTYSARLMARTMGGTISMTSSEEEGTTITVTLPLHPSSTETGD